MGDRPRFATAHGAGIDGLIAVTLPLVVVSALVSPSVIGLVFSEAFLPSAPALTVLCIALVFIMHNAWQGFGLLAAGFQRTILLYDAAGLVVNLVLNFWLITRFGYMGAAWAALATSVFIAACSLLASSTHLRVRQSSGRVLGVVAANGVLYGVLCALLQVGVFWASATLVAVTTYPGWLLLFRVVTIEELRRLAPRESGVLAGASGTAGV
jgi:O-antigen/teichoic acid export membrane protein